MPTHVPAQLRDVRVETKTKDNVYVQVVLDVHCYPLRGQVDSTFEDVSWQIAAAVCETVDARIPEMTIDDVLKKKREVADIVKLKLTPLMLGFGYGILKTPVTDIRMRGSRDRWAPGFSTLPGVDRSRVTDGTLTRSSAAIVQDETI